MAIGSRRRRGDDEYIFIDGKVMRSDEVLRIDVETLAPGQEEVRDARDRSAKEEAARSRGKDAGRFARSRAAMRAMSEDDAFGLRGEGTLAPGAPGAPGEGELEGPDARPVNKYNDRLMYEDRRQNRRRCLIVGGVLAAIVLVSLCLSHGYYFTFYSPVDVVHCYAEWFRLRFVQIFDPTSYTHERQAVMQSLTMYGDVMSQVLQVMKYTFCGVLLAIAGALYQNTFRNPIAAPSMLGVSNGINIALVVLVLIYGTTASSYTNLYYLFSFIGGGVMLVLVILGGRWISGNGRFSVVNMLLMGTIMSQMAGVILTYVQSYVFTEDEWYEYYMLQTATDVNSYWSFITIAICTVITLIPVIAFRFQLNLVSFSDAETKLLGIDPEKLRIMALVCGSLMVLTAQVNTGQVSMVSLIVPFIARATFGAEFRKQLVGTSLIGALLLLVCGDLTSFIYIENIPLDLGSIVTVITLPLFIWMLAVQQRAWE